MWITRVSINNPVFATMVMVALTVLGLFSYARLRVEQMIELFQQRAHLLHGDIGEDHAGLGLGIGHERLPFLKQVKFWILQTRR